MVIRQSNNPCPSLTKEGREKPQGRGVVRRLLLSLAAAFCLMTGSAWAAGEQIADYTAYPPFLPRVTSPNILFMLDYSQSMVKPAYGTCTSLTGISDCRYTYSNLTYDYDSAETYSGYFDTTSGSNKYNCADSSTCVKNPSGVWSGNYLNWLTTTQFDIMKKVTVGGDIDPAPEQGNPTKIRSLLTSGYTFRKQMDLPGSGNSSSCSSTDSPQCTQWPTATYSWLSCSGSCSATNIWSSSAIGTSYDNYASGAQTLPFPFTFYGTTYNQIYISTNGLLSFDPTLASDTSLLNDDVESGTGSWTATGLWHRETTDSCATPQSGSAMWYYGQNSTCTFNNGATNSGYLTSGTMALPAGQAARLSFWYATRTEGLVDSYDKRFVQISTNGGTSWADLAQITDEDDPLVWRQKVIDLTAYAGQSIKIRFYFDTVDSVRNDYKGWFIDDIDVTSSAPSTATLDNTNLDLPDSANPNALIAPYWDDLIVKGKSGSGGWTSKVYRFTSGTAPNRIFVVTYENVRHKLDEAATTTANNMTFQVLFYEGSNHIVFQYNDVKGTTTYGGGKSATIGIESIAGSGAKKYSYCTACASAAVSNSQAIFATPHISYNITPAGGTANTTLFQPAAPLATTSNDYNAHIDINSVAKVDGNCPTGSYYNGDRDTCYDHETVGLLQDFRDGELGGTLGFRLGIMQLNGSSSVKDGGKVVKHFNEKDTTAWASLMAATRGQGPTTVTPLAEALQIAEGYFKQDTAYNLGLTSSNSWTNHGTGSTCASTGNNYDPYCFQSAAQRVSCCKSFVLIASSGNYSNDNRTNIYGDAADTDAQLISGAWSMTPDETSGSEGLLAKGGWLDDVAYKAHTTDWRSDLEGTQNLTVYTVNTFGSGSGNGMGVLKRAAIYGGFEDADGDNAYDADKYAMVSGQCTRQDGGAYGEDDRNCNGVPDTYFEASGGGDLKAKVIDAVTDILKSSASGTTVSVLSTSASGEGAIYQAYFYPAKIENVTEERTWPGFMRGFFLDKFQNLRDDYSGGATPDAKLVMQNSDRIARLRLDTVSSTVQVDLFADTDGDGAIDGSATTTDMDNVVTIWEAGKKLALREKSARNIYTWADLNGDGAVLSTDSAFDNSGETRLFTTDNKDALKPYLCAGNATCVASSDEAGNMINFVRGNAVTGYRNRCITISGATTEAGCSAGSNQRVWALGDIVYSTPTLVSGPGEKFDEIYGDSTYRTFRNRYANRRSVIYTGGNDGLLHAFNGGVYKIGDDLDTTTVVESGRFIANSSSSVNGFTNGWSSSIELGDELWAFVPQDNLPHLAWLACNGTATDPSVCGDAEYTHVYYVDQRPKVTDARIFSDDTDHPGGWGTILIMAMRLGGGAINVDLNADGDTADAGEQSFRSAFYVFDITNPENPPKLLWRFYDSGLGFTTSYPAIAKVCSDPTTSETCKNTEKWYMVVGSGPKNETGTNNRDYGGSSTTQAGKIYVVNLLTSAAHIFTNAGVNNSGASLASNTFMGDPMVVDENLDFSADAVYIGSAVSITTGKVYRIRTKGDDNPANWELSTLIDAGRPLLVSPSASKDSQGKLWIFFGTGRLRSQADLSNFDQQYFYGIKDDCGRAGTGSCTTLYTIDPTATGTERLVDVSAVRVTSDTGSPTQVEGGTLLCGGTATCSYTGLRTEIRKYGGWYTKLTIDGTNPSEKVLSRSVVLGGLLLFTAYKPTGDMCSIFGDSNLYGLYYETGTAYIKPALPAGTTEEQAAVAAGTVLKSISLGKGMPTAVGVAIGETVAGFVQKSTGEIVRIEVQPGLGVRSGAASWREKTGGGGTSEIETIYKHIVK